MVKCCSVCTLVGAAIGILLIILGVVLGWAVFPSFIDETIKDSIAIVDKTDQFKRWEELPQPLMFKVNIFNIKNPLDVHQGIANPIIEEAGPYVYKQYRKKNNITFSSDGKTVSYTQQQRFEFDQEASGNLKDDDEIYVLSPYINSILQLAEKASPEMLPQLSGALIYIFEHPTSLFIKTTVRQFLFDGVVFCDKDGSASGGNMQKVCEVIKSADSDTIFAKDNHLRFAFFHHKQAKPDGVYEVYTGTDEIRDTTVIKTWNGKSVVDAWKPDSHCNKIEGTDGISYQPFQKAEGKITTFISDICRTVEVHYDEEITYKGITGYRFSPRGSFLNEIGPEFSNDCYCINQLIGSIVQENGCLYRGALDLFTCQHAPLVLTSPHLLDGAKEYSDLIEGYKPSKDKHLTFLEMEPITGTPLRGGKRVQFNMFIRAIPKVRFTQNYKTALMPILWLEESLELSDELVDLLNESLFDLVGYLYVGIWVIIGVGIALFISMIILYFCCRNR